jgi:AraC family transcriptional regulator, regulatory protein of adaptative response / DNA-3-methyladenine glycosylase II
MSVVTAAPPTVRRLDTRPPFDGAGVLRWLAARAIPGVEDLSNDAYRRTLRLPRGAGIVAIVARGDHVEATFEIEHEADLDDAVAACRRLFDLDADPRAHRDVLAADPALARLVAATPGMRAPGTVDPAESAVRAVLGQQVSLAAARTLARRLVDACGTPLATPEGTLTHVFPAPEAIADERVLAGIGMPGARQRTLHALCSRLANGDLVLDARADPLATREDLLAIPGIGPWTADYVMLRALGHPDAFPAGDLGLRRAARALGLPDDTDGLEAYSERWRPWRRYAAHYLWAAGA